MALPPDDDEVDLGISLAKVAAIVDQARVIQGLEEEAPEEEEPDPEIENDGATPAEEEDITEDTLRAFIAELNEDEQTALLALAYVGRGDFGPEEWEEAQEQAREREPTEDVASSLLDMELLGDLLSEGVAAFGLALEDIDR